MIQAIPNQPHNFLRIIESEICDDSACGDRKTQCRLLNKTKDWLSFQFRNPADNDMSAAGFINGASLIYANTFNAIGSEEVSGVDITWDSANERFCKNPAIDSKLVLGTNPFQAGKYYRYRALLSNHDGTTQVRFVNNDDSISSQYYTASGWMDFTFLSDGSDIWLVMEGAGTCCIEELEIYELGTVLDIGVGWNILDSDVPGSDAMKFCHDETAAAANPIISAYTISSGNRYRINFRITDRTAGSLQLVVGGYTESFGSNGYYTRWVDAASSGPMKFIPDAEFDGCFEVIAFGQQANRHVASLFDLDQNFMFDLTPYGFATKDFYTFHTEFTNLPAFPDGCYHVCIYDFNRIYGQGADRLQGKLDFNTADGWTLSSGASINPPGYLQMYNTGNAYRNIPGVVSNGGCYVLEIKYKAELSSYADAGGFKIMFDARTLYQCGPIKTTSAGVIRIPFKWTGAFSGDINLISPLASTTLHIDYIRIFRDPACDPDIPADYCSDCIAIKTDTGCTKQLTAAMELFPDEAGRVRTKTAFGFDWNGTFRPIMRIIGEFHESKYPTDEDNYLDNSGSHNPTASELQKKWDFAISQLTESDHDAIRMMIRTDYLGIFSDDFLNHPEIGNYYFCPTKELSPAWPKKDKTSAADVEFELQRRFTEAIYNRNILFTR